jgi:hypothetical protein
MTPDPSSIRSALTDLKPLADSLDAETENMNALIAEVEESLASDAMGLNISVRVSEQDVECGGVPAVEMENLSYARHNSEWGLWVTRFVYRNFGTETEELLENSTPVRLSKAARDRRLAAFERITDLLAALKAESAQKVEAIREALGRQ